MARNISFRIPIAYEAFEEFAAVIRPQGMAERVAAQLKSEFAVKTLAQFRRPDPKPKSNNQTKEYK